MFNVIVFRKETIQLSIRKYYIDYMPIFDAVAWGQVSIEWCVQTIPIHKFYHKLMILYRITEMINLVFRTYCDRDGYVPQFIPVASSGSMIMWSIIDRWMVVMLLWESHLCIFWIVQSYNVGLGKILVETPPLLGDGFSHQKKLPP